MFWGGGRYCSANLNDDGHINAGDLGILLGLIDALDLSLLIGQFGQVGDDLSDDIDQNGVVAAADLQILQSYYLEVVSGCE